MAMLQDAKLPSFMWGEATPCSHHNATPTSALNNMTLYEAWHKEKPNLGMLRVFGCRAYVHVQKQNRQGLQSHTRRCIYLGFEDGYKGWKCYDLLTKSIVISRNVIFDENTSPGLTIPNESAPSLPQAILPHPIPQIHADPVEHPTASQPQSPTEHTSEPQPSEEEPNAVSNTPEPNDVTQDIEQNEDEPTTNLPRCSGRQPPLVNYRTLNDPLLWLQAPPNHEALPFKGASEVETYLALAQDDLESAYVFWNP